MNKTLDKVPAEMANAMHQSLKVWAELGYPNAVIPAFEDMDNDGAVDYFAMSSFGQLELLGEEQVQAVAETVEGYEGPAWVRA